MITRRKFLGGLVAAPAVITTPGLLMPVKKLVCVGHVKPVEWLCVSAPLHDDPIDMNLSIEEIWNSRVPSPRGTKWEIARGYKPGDTIILKRS